KVRDLQSRRRCNGNEGRRSEEIPVWPLCSRPGTDGHEPDICHQVTPRIPGGALETIADFLQDCASLAKNRYGCQRICRLTNRGYVCPVQRPPAPWLRGAATPTTRGVGLSRRRSGWPCRPWSLLRCGVRTACGAPSCVGSAPRSVKAC